ncbi:MAG: Pirin domain protein [Bacteriovoracaceae bacterium]|nr:Pirin domain protein [Bacteriovoracaceae bacterium]
MIQIRKSSERGHFDHGWLNTYHTFSFGDYQDPQFMGFRSLRVINEDRVSPGKGFGTHSHRDMEIITYVLEGKLSHKDSMGNGSVIVPGDVQFMSAGSGVTHSEFNHSSDEPVHFLQIWILPKNKSAQPQYGQKTSSEKDKLGKLRLVVSSDGRQNSIPIGQDADIYASILEGDQTSSLPVKPNRFYWIQVASGELLLNDLSLKAGDGAALRQEATAEIKNRAPRSEFLFFDLA